MIKLLFFRGMLAEEVSPLLAESNICTTVSYWDYWSCLGSDWWLFLVRADKIIALGYHHSADWTGQRFLFKSYFRIFWHENLQWPHWWGSGKKYSTMKVFGRVAGNCGWVFLPFEFSKESFILKFCFPFLLSLHPLSFCLLPPSFPSMVSCWLRAQWVAAVNLPSIGTERVPGVSLARILRLLLHPVGITLFIFPADTNHP